MSFPFEDFNVWLVGQVFLIHFLVCVFLTGVYHQTFSKLSLPRGRCDVLGKINFIFILVVLSVTFYLSSPTNIKCKAMNSDWRAIRVLWHDRAADRRKILCVPNQTEECWRIFVHFWKLYREKKTTKQCLYLWSFRETKDCKCCTGPCTQ